MTNLYEKVRRLQAKAEKARKAAEYKKGESARRSFAAECAAERRIEAGIERALQTGVAKTRREQEAIDNENFHGYDYFSDEYHDY